MSGIVLSASVRQNLLSLQSTASLLATTQNDLATGNKVNSALDNPTNYFTAQSLNNRASDINNLLDGIGNGVQVLQAANTGITSLQSLVDSAKSIANQALQTTVGYSTLSHVSTTIAGATSSNLLGTTSFNSTTASSNILYSGLAGGATAATSGTKLGGTSGVSTGTAVLNTLATPVAITAATTLYGAAGTDALTTSALSSFADGDTFSINGKTVTIKNAATPTNTSLASGTSGVSGNVVTDGSGNSTVYLNAATNVGDLLKAFDLASGVQVAANSGGTATVTTATGQSISTISAGGAISLHSTTGQDLTVTGKADDLAALGLTAATGSGNATVQAFRSTGTASLGSLITAGSTLNVDGHVISFADAVVPAVGKIPSGSGFSGNVVTDGAGNSTVYLQGGTIADVLKAVDLATGVQTAVNTNGTAALTTATGQTVSSISTAGALKISTGVNADLAISGTGNALAALGLAGNTGTASAFSAARTAGVGGISGKTLTFSAFNGGTAVNVTFGAGAGQIQTLNDLNTELQKNNLNATVDANGVLTISAANNYASSTIGSAAAGGVIGGTLPNSLTFSTASAPIADANAQATRANLVAQYNNVLQQINTTSQDASFNGVNLLNGDQLKLVFNETGKSTLNITGVTFNSAGLGLSSLNSGTDFIDNSSTNNVLSSLTSASSTLRSEASSLGSNLSIVQIRQDFSKNLINVLQTGSSNLTLADTNAEAANSQALSTRQSIAVSALSLANQSQQSVLQLLR
jgi:flagellin-like hook-associated protein FlgL